MVRSTATTKRQVIPEHHAIPASYAWHAHDHREVLQMVQSSEVGLTEAEACEQYKHIKCYISKFRAMKYAMSEVQEKTYMKIIVCEDSDQVLGMHVVGTDAGEMIQGFAVAIKQGLTRTQLQKTIGIHPTSAEELVTL